MAFRILLTIGLSLWLVTPRAAQAIPAFARDMKVPCTTCHVQFPKLNALGMQYKQNGYRMPGQKGRFVWTENNLPIAAMTALMVEDMRMKMVMGGTPTRTNTRTATRKELTFFSGGPVGPRASFFIDFNFEETELSTGDTVDTAEANRTFVILNDLVSDSRLNLKAGVMDNEFMYLSNARKTTMRDYLAPVSRQHTGVELNGQNGAFRYAAGYGNDEMVGTSGVDNNLRGGYGWGTYTRSGQTLGVRLYGANAGSAAGADRVHTQFDANVDLHAGPTELIVAYFLQGNVDAVDGADQDNLLVEAIYAATPKVLLTGRYENQDTNAADRDTQWVASAWYFLLPNMSMVAEYIALRGNERVDRGGAMPATMDMDMVMLGFHVGF